MLYYERLLASRKKVPVRKEARENLAAVEPEAVCKLEVGAERSLLVVCSAFRGKAEFRR